MSVLTIEGLTKRYGKITAVDGLNLEVEKGMSFGILGPNGSGKTTTLGIVLGIIHQTAGGFAWFGGRYGEWHRHHIGALLETPNFYPYLNAVDNLRLIAHIRRVKEPRIDYLLELVNHKGFATDTFYVMSGFRTPYYNDAIGNVRYSRHQWGGAADIFIDSNPKDGVMDDLNRDGVIDVRDAAVLYRLFDDESFKDGYKPMIGGLGQYKKTSSHGPFVHVDVRGFRARWGH